ncbi:cytochrome c oxidase subunit I [Humisphaera borealis]|uniref:Cytochrome c oxidase subunit 1 n=1 Tax=Humisphaera borealis TaxID=2807512 RepID=A0A7M2X2A2_9BACT|nr:cytochrome c oxidase subunit I [Humisphaera borealis]QOV91552.1 cytochrome c oxidase subunit I [Humisphaera borealis]
MTTIPVNPELTSPLPLGRKGPSYLDISFTVKSWLLTLDHKRIAILYLLSMTALFIVGGAFATMMRLELTTPQGDFVKAEAYNKLFTMHGVTMVFFFLIPSVPATLGNFLVPLMIGARDLAFPRINLASWYLFIIGAAFTLAAMFAGGVDTGWTFYTPYSSVYSNSQVALAVVGIFITGFSSVLTGLNFIVTVHKMRAPGMTWFRLPLFIWSNYAAALIMVLGTPVISITMVLVAVERLFGVGIFDPANGGDPVLFQHMFWFYSHPAVYIMVLPAFGVISELMAAFSRKPVFGYKVVAFASLAIALLSFVVWGHHLFTTGQSVYAALVFSVLSFLVGIPTAIKVFNWTFTMYKGSVSLETPMLFALGFLGIFTLGGLTGLFLAAVGLDIHLHDTYFVVAHFHYVMVGGVVLAFMGGLHYWWPKITGRMYNEFWGKMSAILIFFGFNLTFFPQFILGYLGMPRRYYAYASEFQVLNILSSAGASILASGYLLPGIYLAYSFVKGPKAGDNPWGAKGLEWQTSSPPPVENFKKMPIVTEDCYNYPLVDPHDLQPEDRLIDSTTKDDDKLKEQVKDKLS